MTIYCVPGTTGIGDIAMKKQQTFLSSGNLYSSVG